MAFEESLAQLKKRIALRSHMGKVEHVALTLLSYLANMVEASAIPPLSHGELEFFVPQHEGFWRDVSGTGRELIIRHRTSNVHYDPILHLNGFREYLIREANLLNIPSEFRSELVRIAGGLTVVCKASRRPRTGIAQYRLVHNRECGLDRLNTILGRISKTLESAAPASAAPTAALAVAEFLVRNFADDEHVLLINALTSYKASSAEKACLGRVLDKVFPNHNIPVSAPPTVPAATQPISTRPSNYQPNVCYVNVTHSGLR